MSSRFSGMIRGPSSLGLPMPSKMRPSISKETPSSKVRPRKRTLLPWRFIPAEPSKSWIKALVPSASRTRPRRRSPVERRISTSSSNLTFSTPSTSIKGPATSRMVIYSLSTLFTPYALDESVDFGGYIFFDGGEPI